MNLSASHDTPLDSSKRVSVIDVGSNSIKVLIAERVKGSNAIHAVFQEKLDVRISTGIGQEGKKFLREDCILQGVTAVHRLVELSKSFHPDIIYIAATSAVRSAENGHIFKEKVKTATGLDLQILSGNEEAAGIALGLSTDPLLDALTDFVAFDLGGGSMEYLLYKNKNLVESISLPLGAVRLTEQILGDSSNTTLWKQPFSPEVFTAFSEKITSTLHDYHCTPPLPGNTLIGAGGVCQVTHAIFAYKAGISLEESIPILPLKAIKDLYWELANMSLEQRSYVPGLPAARADIFPAALAVIINLAQFTQSDAITHSTRNLRYGIAKKLLFSY